MFLLFLAMSVCIAVDGAHAASIPRAAQAHRALLIRSARAELGLTAPVATLAAQVQQESAWAPSARSGVGAMGLAQMMPATAAWLGEIRPDLGRVDAWSPAWALRALAAYDGWLLPRVRACGPCDRWAMALSGYNGGLGWVYRDQREASRQGLDPAAWWGSVERVNAGRSAAAWAENRGYPRRILRTLEPLYEAAGWGQGVCP